MITLASLYSDDRALLTLLETPQAFLLVSQPAKDSTVDPAGRSFWQCLLDLAICVLAVCAMALIGNPIVAITAHARDPHALRPTAAAYRRRGATRTGSTPNSADTPVAH